MKSATSGYVTGDGASVVYEMRPKALISGVYQDQYINLTRRSLPPSAQASVCTMVSTTAELSRIHVAAQE